MQNHTINAVGIFLTGEGQKQPKGIIDLSYGWQYAISDWPISRSITYGADHALDE